METKTENARKVEWDNGGPCSHPKPAGMVYPEKPTPRHYGYTDGSGVEWSAYDTTQMETYARTSYAAGYQKACDDFADEA